MNSEDEGRNELLREQVERLKRENAQLKKWALMTDEQVVMDLKVLITELCAALEYPSEVRAVDLFQRAREATR